jgi:hypothetical protein
VPTALHRELRRVNGGPARQRVPSQRERLAAGPSEWRRICHWYIGDDQIFVCGTALQEPGEDHDECERAERGHAISSICSELSNKTAT